MVTTTATRRLAAILAADVAGYSPADGRGRGRHARRLKAHRRELIDPKIAEHHGRIVKTTGDGMLVEFRQRRRCGALRGRDAAGMVDRNADEPRTDASSSASASISATSSSMATTSYGDGVNIAARLEALAEPGGVCVSRTVRDQIGDRLPYAFDDMGQHTLRNIARPVRVYALKHGRCGDIASGHHARAPTGGAPP